MSYTGAGAAQTYARGLDKRVVSSQRAPTPGSSARAEEQPPATRSGKLESLQLELQEANAHREALARNLVPNYFSFPLGKEMILSQAVDLHRLAEQLGVFAQRGEPHSPLAAQIVGEAASARKSAKASAKDKTPKQKTPAAQLAASSTPALQTLEHISSAFNMSSNTRTHTHSLTHSLTHSQAATRAAGERRRWWWPRRTGTSRASGGLSRRQRMAAPSLCRLSMRVRLRRARLRSSTRRVSRWTRAARREGASCRSPHISLPAARIRCQTLR